MGLYTMMRVPLFLLLVFGAGSVMAETAYVTDKLRLGVHAAADTSDRAFTSLNSGEAVEIIERNGSFVQVRIEDGREGWVRGAFLLTDEPAARQLPRVQAKNEALEAELAALKASTADPAAELDGLKRSARKSQLAAEQLQTRLQAAQTELDELRARTVGQAFSVPAAWLLGAAGLALLCGFGFAWWLFDRRSRQRHGGFRIY